MQKYTAKNYNHLQNIGQISNEAMQMHFKLYEGYVNNVNLLLERCNFLKEKLKNIFKKCQIYELIYIFQYKTKNNNTLLM